MTGGFLVIRGAHDFLAVNAPVETSVLVVEGWLPNHALTNFVAHSFDYSMIYTTGGPTPLDRDSRDVSDTYASVAYGHLRKAGVLADRIRLVPAGVARRDRTYTSALALHEWCRSNNVSLSAFNVVTMGPHARRSRLLHQKAFGPDVKVGVIPLTNGEYDANHWWRYSEGVRETMSETAAYLYARFLFSPD